MRRTISWLGRFWGDARGAIAVEFGIVTPVLILMIIGTFEVTRYVLLHQKLDRMAVAAGDLVSQGETIATAQLTDIFSAAGLIAEPFAIGDAGVVIISGLYRAIGTTPVRIAWQRSGTGTLPATSRFGAQGAIATLPTDFTLREGDSAIVAEVYYDFRSYLAPDLLPARQLYHRAIFRPRRGTLEVLLP